MNWRGDEVLEKLVKASKLGVDRTTAACVEHAKGHHPWNNVTGTAEGSIQMRPATVDGDNRVRGEFGSYGVDYFLWLEIGTSRMPARPSLRPAFDAEVPKLTKRIKDAMGDV